MFSLQVRDIFGRYNMWGAISSMFMKMLSVKSHTTGTYARGAMNMFTKIALVCTILVCIVNPVISHALPVRSTGRPPVLLVLPSPGAFDISPSSSISVTIDTRAGAPAERFNLRLTTAGRNVPGRVIRDNIHSVISFAPLKHMLKDTPYRVHLEFIEQKDDRYSIKPIFSWEFATGPKPLSEPVTNVGAQLAPPPVPPTNDIPEEEIPQEPEQYSLDLDRIRNLTELFRSRREEKAGGKTAGIKIEPVSPERSKPEPSEEVLKRQHIILTLPSPGAREIATSSSISATIDSFAGIPLKNVNLKISADGKAVPGRVTRDLTHNVISFSPLSPLAEEATYEVTLEHLKRTNGHYEKVPVHSWKFTTKAGIPLQAVSPPAAVQKKVIVPETEAKAPSETKSETAVKPVVGKKDTEVMKDRAADDSGEKPSEEVYEEESEELRQRIAEIFRSRQEKIRKKESRLLPEKEKNQQIPAVLLTLPSPGARNIATTSRISITLDRPAGSSLERFNVKMAASGRDIPGRIERDLSHSVITFEPLFPLQPATAYQVQLEQMKRTNGHYVTEPVFSWDFSTRAPLPVTEVAEASVTPLAAEREIFEPTADDRLDKPEEDSSEITRRISEIFSSRGAQPGPAVKIEKEIPGEIPATREPRDEGDTGEDDQVTASIRKLYDIVRDRGGYSPTVQSSSGDRRAGSEQHLAARKPTLEPNQVTENDVLDINIWGHPELSAKYNVSPRGDLGFPLLGDIEVSGKTVEQVKQLLTERLGKDYIRNPFITIFHRRGRSIRINILGKIGRPGIYTFPEPPTLLEALAAAGGTSPSSGKREVSTVQLVRSPYKEDLDLHNILVKGNFKNNYYLEDRDTLILKEELLQERIYIFGSMLKEQGIFRYEPGMTVLDAILLAGGSTTPPEVFEKYRPRFKNTRIVRGYLDKPEVLVVDVDRVLFRGDLSRNIALKPGDIVIVPTRRVRDFWAWLERIQPLLSTILTGDSVVKLFE